MPFPTYNAHSLRPYHTTPPPRPSTCRPTSNFRAPPRGQENGVAASNSILSYIASCGEARAWTETFLSEFLDLNGDGHVTPEEARIGLSFLETALHREPEMWDEDGFDENAADDDGEYGFGGYLLDDE